MGRSSRRGMGTWEEERREGFGVVRLDVECRRICCTLSRADVAVRLPSGGKAGTWEGRDWRGFHWTCRTECALHAATLLGAEVTAARLSLHAGPAACADPPATLVDDDLAQQRASSEGSELRWLTLLLSLGAYIYFDVAQTWAHPWRASCEARLSGRKCLSASNMAIP